MKEKKIGGLDISSGGADSNGRNNPLTNGYIISLFGHENVGKTRFALSGPGPVGFVPLETKAYPTIEKDGDDAGVEVVRPSDQHALLVNPRKVNMYEDTKERTRVAAQQLYYIEHVKKVEAYTYGLLESDEIRAVCIDKFNTYCNWVQFAVNGMEEKFVKTSTGVYKDRKEINQHIVDFLNSLGQYGKLVILNNATRGDYDGPLDSEKKPQRQTWEGFKYLGSHSNLVVELVNNPLWHPEKNGEKYDWKYKLNIRRCQHKPELEGPDGEGLLKDDMITIPRLMKKVLGERYVAEQWVGE